MRRVNDRMDIASRKPFPQEELLRFRLLDGKLSLSPGGRGYYLKKDLASLEAAIKRKAFERILRRSLLEEEITLLKEAL